MMESEELVSLGAQQDRVVWNAHSVYSVWLKAVTGNKYLANSMNKDLN